MDTKSLKVGDEVGYMASYNYNRWQIVKVKHITPTGRVTLENNAKFNANGNKIGNSREVMTDLGTAVESNAAYDAKNKIADAVLRLEAALKSKHYYGGYGHGQNYNLTEAQLKLVMDLADSLESKQSEPSQPSEHVAMIAD